MYLRVVGFGAFVLQPVRHVYAVTRGKGEVSKDGQRAARRSWIGDQAHRTIRSARSSETSHAAVRVAAAVPRSNRRLSKPCSRKTIQQGAR